MAAHGRMARKILRAGSPDDFDFKLIGIVSQQRDYRLCHFLNQQLGLHLRRAGDYEIVRPQNRQVLAFALYKYEPADAPHYYLFSNTAEGGFLVPEYRHIDYFLMVKEYQHTVQEESLTDNIKRIPLVLGAYVVQAESLRTRENLIF
jgi:hypothetical protein